MIETYSDIIPALRNTRWLIGSASTAERRTQPLPLQTGTNLFNYDYAENATDLRLRPREIDQKLRDLIEIAREEVFEDGFANQLSRGLEQIVRRYGESAIESLANYIVNEKINIEIAAEILRWLGRINHPWTYAARLWLLERGLFCSSARVRDGALLGLASLDDPFAIPRLKQAIAQEKIVELRNDMQQVLAQLEEKLS